MGGRGAWVAYCLLVIGGPLGGAHYSREIGAWSLSNLRLLDLPPWREYTM